MTRPATTLEVDFQAKPDEETRSGEVAFPNVTTDFEPVYAGIDLGGTKCLGILAGADGRVFAETIRQVNGDATAALLAVWESLTDGAAAVHSQISNLGIGIPAVVDPETGLVVRGPNTNWDEFDLSGLLNQFGVPYYLDNDVNLAAYAESVYGQANNKSCFVVVNIGTGLGGAIMVQGNCLRGWRNGAGEFGALPTKFPPLKGSDLEATLSGVGIAARARDYLTRHPEQTAILGPNPDARNVIEAALHQQKAGLEIVEQVIGDLVYCLTALGAVIDPELVVLDGSVGRALAPYLAQITTLVAEQLPNSMEITVSNLEPSSTALGAIAALIKNTELTSRRDTHGNN